jgi:hypothetical protein
MKNLSDSISRRDIIRVGAVTVCTLTCGGKSLLSPSPCTAQSTCSHDSLRFRHRGYLGWITDLATQPDPSAQWPSMRLDTGLLDDYSKTFEVMQMIGFNEISIWGLYVSRSWPLDIAASFDSNRGSNVEQLIEQAHRRGIRIYSGLGVYSWGFDDIINNFPDLARTSSQAMCASEPKAWEWMQRVINFIFDRFAIDGVSMQSADQGRCHCSQCKGYSDAEYHSLLNTRVAEYIRSRWPDKSVGVNSWGLRFNDQKAMPALVRMSDKVDYIIDVHDSSRYGDLPYRKKLVEALHCDFGTLGGPQVEPPQHWKRNRWFLPTVRRVGEHLEQLFDDGGRACEFFFHILANPGDELTMWLAGKILSEPAIPWREHLSWCIEKIYEVSDHDILDDLAEIFLWAEDAYFRYLPGSVCGTVSLEPLVSNHPGPPIYLSDRIYDSQRKAYGQEMVSIKGRLEKLSSRVSRRDKINNIITCIDGCLEDLMLLAGTSRIPEKQNS